MFDLFINERQLVPVRMIPFLTGWQFSPDVVAKILAKMDKWHRVFIPSFHILDGIQYQPMLPKEWDVILADMDMLQKTLKAKEKVEDENYPAWREESVKLLPAGTFVWLDELEAAWNEAYSPERLTLPEERAGDRALNFTPHIPSALSDYVYQGFEQQVPNAKQKEIEQREYEVAFNEFADELPKLKRKLEELESITARDMGEYEKKNKEIEKIEQRIAGIIHGDVATNETPDERKQRLEMWYEEEKRTGREWGALQRTAEREGIARQTLSGILKRKPNK